MEFLSEKQQQQFEALCAHEEDCVIVEVTWLMYKDPIAALNHPRKQEGKKLVCKVTGALSKKLPQRLEELAQLSRTLSRRREDILAYFDVSASNGPVEAINGRLEQLCGIALGLRNLDHYILRCLTHSGQSQGKINAL